MNPNQDQVSQKPKAEQSEKPKQFPKEVRYSRVCEKTHTLIVFAHGEDKKLGRYIFTGSDFVKAPHCECETCLNIDKFHNVSDPHGGALGNVGEQHDSEFNRLIPISMKWTTCRQRARFVYFAHENGSIGRWVHSPEGYYPHSEPLKSIKCLPMESNIPIMDTEFTLSHAVFCAHLKDKVYYCTREGIMEQLIFNKTHLHFERIKCKHCISDKCGDPAGRKYQAEAIPTSKSDTFVGIYQGANNQLQWTKFNTNNRFDVQSDMVLDCRSMPLHEIQKRHRYIYNRKLGVLEEHLCQSDGRFRQIMYTEFNTTGEIVWMKDTRDTILPFSRSDLMGRTSFVEITAEQLHEKRQKGAKIAAFLRCGEFQEQEAFDPASCDHCCNKRGLKKLEKQCVDRLGAYGSGPYGSGHPSFDRPGDRARSMDAWPATIYIPFPTLPQIPPFPRPLNFPIASRQFPMPYVLPSYQPFQWVPQEPTRAPAAKREQPRKETVPKTEKEEKINDIDEILVQLKEDDRLDQITAEVETPQVHLLKSQLQEIFQDKEPQEKPEYHSKDEEARAMIFAKHPETEVRELPSEFFTMNTVDSKLSKDKDDFHLPGLPSAKDIMTNYADMKKNWPTEYQRLQDRCRVELEKIKKLEKLAELETKSIQAELVKRQQEENIARKCRLEKRLLEASKQFEETATGIKKNQEALAKLYEMDPAIKTCVHNVLAAGHQLAEKRELANEHLLKSIEKAKQLQMHLYEPSEIMTHDDLLKYDARVKEVYFGESESNDEKKNGSGPSTSSDPEEEEEEEGSSEDSDISDEEESSDDSDLEQFDMKTIVDSLHNRMNLDLD
ncbi:Protein CBG08468 [Caenorhabditis briggsae]|uniref:Uncharacterized protein n=3 Tax=Caenorhabditis briggsae TaxID=6238 RepID=A0AAE9DWQ7_CAEBR|nr:Protein CBG08468 [Caenorhabditis briggsae]ULU13361.1 hypothetical protein L3Y34_016095 [Caenorhabditis briggsae]CAP28285.1 Protein CBG08468 [Caenorhabditis briggsae]